MVGLLPLNRLALALFTAAIIEQILDESLKPRDALPQILPLVQDDICVGMLLVDASGASSKALGADVGIIGRENAPNLPATAYKVLETGQ